MKSAVVTGANGFLGRALTMELRRQGIRVLAVARRHGGLPQDPEIIPVTLDLAGLPRLASLTKERWDVFYHLAWAGTSGGARRDIHLQLSNIEASAEAVRAAKSLGCGRFVGAGSIMERELLAASAEPQSRPGSGHIYSAAKLAAHQISRCVAAELGIDHIWAVITNAFGEGERSPRLLNTTLRKIIGGEDLNFTSATQNYDFIYVDDAARAFRLLGRRGVAFSEYTVGSGGARPLREFLMELCSAMAPGKTPVFGSLAFDGVSLPTDLFDISALTHDTGFSPEISFSEGVCRTMRWLQETSKQSEKEDHP